MLGGVKFAAFGDFGTGSRQQYELADVMARVHQIFPFELVTRENAERVLDTPISETAYVGAAVGAAPSP